MTSLSTRTRLFRPFALFYRHRILMYEMAKREITDRYAGQVFGALWAIGHPLILVVVYAFIFGKVMSLKVGGTADMPLDYTAYLLSGLLPWMAFQESLAKGTTAITANSSLVKQVVFPTEVLPAKTVLASLLTQVIGSVCLAVHVLMQSGSLPWTYALLPVLWFFQTLAMIGVSHQLLLVSTGIGANFWVSPMRPELSSSIMVLHCRTLLVVATAADRGFGQLLLAAVGV